MINKLKRKLMIMFLSFTILTFTVTILLVISNTINRIRDYEIDYANNISDSIVKLVQRTNDFSELEISGYNTPFRVWIHISNGKIKKENSDLFEISPDIFSQMNSEDNVIYMQEVASNNNHYNDSSSRAIHLIKGKDRKEYYGIHTIFFANAVQYDMITLHPKSTSFKLFCRYCRGYLFLWLVACILMYYMSHVLIRKALQPVEAAIKSQKEFIASASHELKSPLAVIQINAETLNVEKYDTVSEQKQKIILSECDRMTNLIKSLLSLAAADTGRWAMDMHETDIDTILIETWEMFIESARKKKINFDLNIEEHYPKLNCDKEHIIQTLSILLDNALSYSPSGLSIEMGARVKPKFITFYVIDHGCGIDDTEKKQVFNRFYSGDPSRSEKNHYGLGLSIASEITKLHHGTIILNDTPGGGCTFEIQIPF